MDLQTIIWTMEGMKSEITKLKEEIMLLKKGGGIPTQSNNSTNLIDDLMTLEEVLKKLNMCNNTFQKFVKSGTISPIRMSQRVIRYSKRQINELLLGFMQAE